MASCRLYITQLTKDEKIQDVLTSYHNAVFNRLIDSKLFNKWHDHWFLPLVGDKRYKKAYDLIRAINTEYGTSVVGTAYTKANQKEFVFVNVKNLLEKVKDQLNNPHQGVLFQKPEIQSSKASPKTIEKVKEFLNRIGVKIETLDPKKYGGVNAIANLLQKTIEILEGKENISLSEEAMHFAVALFKETEPSLYTQMYKKIGNYKVYQSTRELYNDDPAYKNADGTPNIPKIKEEAIGKLLAEYYVKDAEGQTENPDLLVQTKTWWQQFVDWIKRLIGKAGFNPFEEAIQKLPNLEGEEIAQDELKGFAEFIANNVTGFVSDTVKHLANEGKYRDITDAAYEQLADEKTYWNTVDKMFGGDVRMADELMSLYQTGFKQKTEFSEGELFNKFDKQIEKYGLQKHQDTSDPDDENQNSYYTVTIDGKQRKTDRTTEYAKRINKEKHGGKDFLSKATEEQKADWARKAMEGTKGHYDLENLVNAALNPDGTIKPINEVRIETQPATNGGVYNILKKYIYGGDGQIGFLYKFPEGTKIRTEQQIYNDTIKPNSYGVGRAGTLDIVATLPDGSVEVYDWKFMGMSDKKTDQSFLKRSQHSLQLADYKRTLKDAYGVKNVKAFTIPIRAMYQTVTVLSTNEKVPRLLSIQIGNVNFKDEEKTYLLPVVPEDQGTGNDQIDVLIKRLKSHYNRIYKKTVSEEDRLSKLEELDQISAAIRNLQVRLNFEPLVSESSNFQAFVKAVLDKYKDSADPSILQELNDLYDSAATYESLDEAFVSEYGYEGLDEKQKKTLDALQLASKGAREYRGEILDKIKSIIDKMSQEQIKATILSPEKEVKGILHSLTEASFVPNSSIKLFTKLLNTARSNQKKGSDERIRTVLNLIQKAGPDAFNKISTKKQDPETKREIPVLVSKLSREFKESLNKAKTTKDKKFILNNINKEKYESLANDYVQKQEKIIADREAAMGYSSDEKTNREIAKQKLTEAKSNVLINRLDFDGWDNRVFNRLISKALKEDESQLSSEYKTVANDQNLLALYDFITELNRVAYKVGYLGDAHSLRFLPLITGTDLERLSQSSNTGATIKNILKDSVSVQIDELQQYGKLDPETGKPTKEIPKFFTRTDKEYEDLSKDLPKILSKYIESLDEFSTNQQLEDIFLSLLKVEENKGHLETDKAGNVIFSQNVPQIFEGNRINTEALEKIGDDAIYGIQEDSDTYLDVAVDKTTKGTEEEKAKRKASAKKVVQKSNAYVQSLAVGLKTLVAIPNYIGAHLQSLINAGHFYKGAEYEKNHAKIITSFPMSDVEKGLIDYFVPLNEQVSKATRRDVLWKQSKIAWLKTWSFRDFLMSTNYLPDKAHELTNALTWLDNTVVVNGKFHNIRQYLRQQPEYKSRYQSPEKIKETEKDFDKKVEELKKQSLAKIAKFDENGYLTIPGIDLASSNYGEYRTKIMEYGRNITSQMSPDNKADYRRNILAKSFAMFKNWIVRQAELRVLDIHKNDLLDEWEYGRLRLYAKLVSHIGLKALWKTKQLTNATPEGLKIMRDILEQKKIDYYKRTGQELEITEEEFFDMMRKELKSEIKEVRLTLSLLAMVLWSYSAAPPDDDSTLNKNRYKYMAKAISKASDELLFYYNPLSTESMTRGTLLPSLGIIAKTTRLLKHTGKEFWGQTTGNDNMVENAHPLKYFLDMIPVASQFQAEILPIIDPETAKELGVKTSAQSRAFQ